MEEFSEAVFFLLEYLFAPQQTVHVYLAAEFPFLFSPMLDSPILSLTLLCGALVLLGVFGFFQEGFYSESINIWFQILVLLSVVAFVPFFVRYLDQLQTARLTYYSVSAAIVLSEFGFGYSVYRVSHWGGRKPAVFISAGLVALITAEMVGRYEATVAFTGFLYIASILMMVRDILEIDTGMFLCFGLGILMTVGLLYQPDLVNRCRLMIEAGDPSTYEMLCIFVACWLFNRSVPLISLLLGFVIGLLREQGYLEEDIILFIRNRVK